MIRGTEDKALAIPLTHGKLALCSVLLLLALAIVPPAPAQDFTVNLKETDIQELIKFGSVATGTSIVVDPAVRGKV